MNQQVRVYLDLAAGIQGLQTASEPGDLKQNDSTCKDIGSIQGVNQHIQLSDGDKRLHREDQRRSGWEPTVSSYAESILIDWLNTD